MLAYQNTSVTARIENGKLHRRVAHPISDLLYASNLKFPLETRLVACAGFHRAWLCQGLSFPGNEFQIVETSFLCL